MTITSVTSASPAAASTAAKTQTLGQGDFIKLMTTQMKMQDPTDPVDNKEMIAQMAQFSSLSGIENINSTLKAISQQIGQALTTKTTQTSA